MESLLWRKATKTLVISLSQGLSSLTRFALHNRQDDDQRQVMTELPALGEIKALVIHSHYLIPSNLVIQYTLENICLECTILHDEGTEHPGYTQQLFKIACVAAYVIRSKSNLILSQLEVGSLNPSRGICSSKYVTKWNNPILVWNVR